MASIMKHPHRPVAWNQFGAGKPAWSKPFLRVEWALRWAAYILGSWALLEVLEYIGSFSILAAVIVYFAGSHDRLEQKHYQAWQVINTAQSKGGSGGRMDALQELNQDRVPLVGVDVSDAYLQEVNLANADLRRSNFRGADLKQARLERANFEQAFMRSANLRQASLRGANLSEVALIDADLEDADLTGANLDGIRLDMADLQNADLSSVSNWKSIAEIKGANIAGVRNAPDGFIAWAIAHGATQQSQQPATQPAGVAH